MMVYNSEFGSEEVTLVVEGLYVESKTPRIELYGTDNEPYAAITVNIPEFRLPKGFVFIDQNLAKDKVRFLEENGLGKCINSLRSFSHGLAVFPIVELDVEKVKAAAASGAQFIDEWTGKGVTA